MAVKIVNPFYICFLSSNILFFRDFDEIQTEGLIFNNIDFDNCKHINILLNELIKPEFMRLNDATKLGVMYSLYYVNKFNNKKYFSVVVECFDYLDISSDAIDYILKSLWEILFDGVELSFEEKDFNISFKPLNDHQVGYVSKTEIKGMSEVADIIYEKILNL